MTFEPPAPPVEPRLRTGGRIVLLTVLVVLIYPLWVVLNPIFVILGLLDKDRFKPYPGRPVQVPPDLAQTAAPVRAVDGRVVCSGCGAAVPFASMSLNEHGYFCPRCAQAARAAAATQAPPELRL